MGTNLDAAVLLSEGLEPLDLVARCSVEIQSEKRVNLTSAPWREGRAAPSPGSRGRASTGGS
jgi:hypothetical protein